MHDLYATARTILLDALQALGPHRQAAILVGAQAIYLHTGDANLAVAAYTTDADLALDPSRLDEIPPLELSLSRAGFESLGGKGVGIWKASPSASSPVAGNVYVDLLVPSSVSPGTGRRAARLAGHHPHAARKVSGIEGVLVDHSEMVIGSLDPARDPRRIQAKVAGPSALLVAKLFKISERHGTPRAVDKDALDVLRLLQAIETPVLADGLRRLIADDRCGAIAETAIERLEELFGNRGRPGALMAARATQPLMDATQVRLSCEALATDLLQQLASE